MGCWAPPQSPLVSPKQVRAQRAKEEQGSPSSVLLALLWGVWLYQTCFKLKSVAITSPKPLPTLAQGSPCFVKSTWEPGHTWAALAWLCQQGSMWLSCRLIWGQRWAWTSLSTGWCTDGVAHLLAQPLHPFKQRNCHEGLIWPWTRKLVAQLWNKAHVPKESYGVQCITAGEAFGWHNLYFCIQSLVLALKPSPDVPG